MMDTLFPNSTVTYRSLQHPLIHHAAYISIIATEAIMAYFLLNGGYALIKSIKSGSEAFQAAKKNAYTGTFKDPPPPSLADMDFPDIGATKKATTKNKTSNMDFALAAAKVNAEDETPNTIFVLEPGNIRLYKNEDKKFTIQGSLPLKKPPISPEIQWEQGLQKMVQRWDNYKAQCIEQQGEDIEKRWFYQPPAVTDEDEDYDDSYSENSYDERYD
jgi:hypothetical protein